MKKHLLIPFILLVCFLSPYFVIADLGDYVDVEINQGTSGRDIDYYLKLSENDPSKEMLAGIIGGIDNFLPGTTSPVSAMFVEFNSALLGVAVLFGLYVFMSGAVQTAHEGQFMGARYHTIWVPLRSAIGLGGIVPMPLLGWSAVQLFMLMAAFGGIGIGNGVMKAGLPLILEHLPPHFASPQAAIQDEALRALVRAQVCTVGHNIELFENPWNGKPRYDSVTESMRMRRHFVTNQDEEYWDSALLVTETQPTGSMSLTYGGDGGEFATDVCGGVHVPLWSLGNAAENWSSTRTGSTSMPPFDMQSVISAHEQALERVAIELEPLSEAIFFREITPERFAKEFTQLRTSYMRYITHVLGQAVRKQDNYLSNFLNNEGKSWVMFGAIFNKLGSVNRDIVNAASIRMEVIEPKNNRYSSTPIYSGMERGEDIFRGFMERSEEASFSLRNPDISSLVSQSLGSKMIMRAVNTLMVGEQDTYTGLINLGYVLFDASLIGIGVGTLKVGAAEAALGSKVLGSGVGQPTSAAWWILAVLFGLAVPLMVSGAFLAFYLPIAPSVMWFLGVISWVMIVLESLIASPLWALIHLDTKGEGMGERTAHGYIFLLHLFFRPPLMVIGLTLGWLSMNILGAFLKGMLATFFGASSYGASGLASVFVFVAVIVTFAVLVTHLVNRTHAFCMTLPDQAIAWVGGHMRGMGGEDANKVEHSVVGGLGMYRQGPQMPGGAKPHGGVQGSDSELLGKVRDLVGISDVGGQKPPTPRS